ADLLHPRQMNPGADNQFLPLARHFAAALRAHAGEVLDRTVHEHVKPAAEVEGWHLHLIVASTDRPLLPVVVPGVVLDPVEEVWRDVLALREQPRVILDRQVFVRVPELAGRLVHAVEETLVAQAARSGHRDSDEGPGLLEGERPRPALVAPAVE